MKTTKPTTIKVCEFLAKIRDYEAELAYGSETQLWGDLLERLREITGRWEPQADCWDEETISLNEAVWWFAAYDLYRDHQDDYDDMQQLYDDVSI